MSRKKQASSWLMHCSMPITGGAAHFLDEENEDDASFLLGLGTNRVSLVSPSSNYCKDLFTSFTDACSSVSSDVHAGNWSATSLAGEVAMKGELQWRFPSQTCTSSCTVGSDVFVGMEFDRIRQLRADLPQAVWQSPTALNTSDLLLIDQEVLVSVGSTGLYLHDLRMGSSFASVRHARGDYSCVAKAGNNHVLALGDYSGGLSVMDSRKLGQVVHALQVERTGRMVTKLVFARDGEQRQQLFATTSSGKLVTMDLDSCSAAASVVREEDLYTSLCSAAISHDNLLLLACDDGCVKLQQV